VALFHLVCLAKPGEYDLAESKMNKRSKAFFKKLFHTGNNNLPVEPFSGKRIHL